MERINFQQIIAESKAKILKEVGDKGTCVIGMRLIYKSVPVAEQIAQGSITNELYFDEVKGRLVEELGY